MTKQPKKKSAVNLEFTKNGDHFAFTYDVDNNTFALTKNNRVVAESPKKKKINKVVELNGKICFYNEKGQLHSRKDKPAVIWPEGTKEWYHNGQRHRENDKPCIEDDSGFKEWRIHGNLHREDGPAHIHPKGRKEWYLNGKPHRKDGPAVIRANGDKEWWLEGKLHRDDGPAKEFADGKKQWYKHGELPSRRWRCYYRN